MARRERELNHTALMHYTHSLLQKSWGTIGEYTKRGRQKKERTRQAHYFADVVRLGQYFQSWRFHHQAVKELNSSFKELTDKVPLSVLKTDFKDNHRRTSGKVL